MMRMMIVTRVPASGSRADLKLGNGNERMLAMASFSASSFLHNLVEGYKTFKDMRGPTASYHDQFSESDGCSLLIKSSWQLRHPPHGMDCWGLQRFH